MAFRVFVLLFLTNCFFTIAQKPSIQVNKKQISTKNYQSVTFNGIWSWFSDPRAVYYEDNHKRTYTGWVDNYGDIHVAYYDHSTKNISSKVIYDNLEIDDHNNPSILIDENGHLIVFFNAHLQDEKPLYMLKASTPESIDHWDPVKTLFLNDKEYYKTAKNLNHTYTNPIKLSAENGKIFLFWRGVDLKPTFSTSIDNGETWSPGKILFMPDENFSVRVPYTKVYSNGVSKIHFTFTDGHPTKETSNALYYMYYEAGAFFKADGTKVKTTAQLPIKQQEIDLVYKQTSKNSKVWNWDIAQNKNGDPIIVYAKFPDNDNHIYSYAIWKKGKWFNYDIVNSGNWFPQTPKGAKELEPNYSGGISIDHQSPNTLYLSVKRNGFFEIEKWITKDEGESWNIKKITSHSTKDNIRPFAIKNAKEENNPKVLWVQNTKYISYSLSPKDENILLKFNDRYHTAIKMDVEYPVIDKVITKKSVIQVTRELLDWQLENFPETINKTSYPFGLFYDGVNTFHAMTNENRYKNELLNILQYSEEEGFEELAIENIIWSYNLDDNRTSLNRLNEVNLKDLENINNDIKIVTLIKLLTLINEEDNIEKKKLTALSLEYIKGLLANKNNYKTYNQFFANTLSLYAIAKGINDGIIPIDHKQKTLKSWRDLTKHIIEKKHKNGNWNIKNTGALLLASHEIYKLLN